MESALIKLLVLRLRGGVRYRVRELKTPRGIAFVFVAVAVITTLAWRPVSLEEQLLLDTLPREQLAGLISLGLIGTCLLTVLTASGPAIYFNPTEISLLFAGPFTRTGLLVYKICFYAAGALLSGLIIALIAAPVAGSALAAFVGSFMMLLFIQLLSASIGLAGLKLSRRGITGLQLKVAVLSLTIVIAIGAWFLSDTSGGFLEAGSAFSVSMFGVVMAPFHVFAETFLAEVMFPDLATWATLAALINGALLAILIRLDAHTDETLIAACEESQHRWERAKRGGYLRRLGNTATAVYSFRCPIALGSLAPIAWRQYLNVMRSSTRTVAAFIMLMLVAGPLLVEAGSVMSPWSRIGLVFFICVFVLPRTLVFDFRSDLDNMENLKALPLRPWCVCAGQVVVPVLLTSIIELVLICSALPFLHGVPQVVVVILAGFTVPFNLLMYSLENTFFLFFPKPLVPIGRVDFDFFGRTLMDLTVKSFLLGCACALAAGLGFLAFQVTDRNWFVFTGVAWVSLILVAALTLPVMAWAYRRYDVGREVYVS